MSVCEHILTNPKAKAEGTDQHFNNDSNNSKNSLSLKRGKFYDSFAGLPYCLLLVFASKVHINS